VVRAYTLAREIFDLEPLWDQIDELDHHVGSALQLDLLSRLTAIAQRASRWILRVRLQNTDMPTLIQRYQPGASELRANLDTWLRP
jgi:glutamate dehydrogenase